jgi:glutathione peroxidase-family protein
MLNEVTTTMTDIYDFTAETLEGRSTALGDYKGRAMLIVNVASKCGFTPQYQGLEALSRKFAPNPGPRRRDLRAPKPGEFWP